MAEVLMFLRTSSLEGFASISVDWLRRSVKSGHHVTRHTQESRLSVFCVWKPQIIHGSEVLRSKLSKPNTLGILKGLLNLYAPDISKRKEHHTHDPIFNRIPDDLMLGGGLKPCPHIFNLGSRSAALDLYTHTTGPSPTHKPYIFLVLLTHPEKSRKPLRLIKTPPSQMLLCGEFWWS